MSHVNFSLKRIGKKKKKDGWVEEVKWTRKAEVTKVEFLAVGVHSIQSYILIDSRLEKENLC